MKKLLTIIAGICLISASHVYGQKGDWVNEPNDYMLSGAGTKDDPYLISSVTDIIYLADRVNMWHGLSFRGVHFLLTNNINLGMHYWIPIGSERNQPFQGVFNGNGKTVYNLHIGDVEAGNVFEASGLFGYLGNGAQILNLNVEGGAIRGGGRESVSRAGCIAGLLTCHVGERGEDSIIIRNCHNKGVEITGSRATVSSTGGLVGEGYSFCEKEGSALILLENCTNSGSVNGSKATFAYTGGIMGNGRGYGRCNSLMMSSTGACVIKSCYNTGTVTGGIAEGKSAIASTGGIAGYGYASGYGYGSMEGAGVFSVGYCINTGTIAGGIAATAQSFTYTGGLLGYADGYGYGNKRVQSNGVSYGSGSFTLNCSANRGNVEGGDVAEMAIASTGGLVGFVSASAYTSQAKADSEKSYGNLDVKNCYNYSTVSAGRGVAGGLAGGIATLSEGAGENRVSAIIHNCYAAGSVICYDTLYPIAAGGIAGRIQQSKSAERSPQIVDCLVALKYLEGDQSRTFRIVGQIHGVQPPYSGKVLTRNYAFVNEGEWVNSNVSQNGMDWEASMIAPPMSNWDFRNKVWLLDEDMMSMPLLNSLPYQVIVPVP